MSYQAWRQGVQLEVAHTVGTYYHCSFLLMESIYNLLQGLWRRIEIVAIQLDGKASAIVTVNGLVPASANAKVRTFRDDDMEFIAMR